MDELIKIINQEFKPKIKLDNNDIDGLKECIELFLTDGIDELRYEIDDLKEELEETKERLRDFETGYIY